MGPIEIHGVGLFPLKIIPDSRGDIYHGMKSSDPGFAGFGEAYFSSVGYGQIKAWKKHLRMTLNLIVPVGRIRFVIFDDRPGSPTRGNRLEKVLSLKNYCRLCIPPGLWNGFQGMERGMNLLLNVADLEHDPNEAERLPVEAIAFDWGMGDPNGHPSPAKKDLKQARNI